LEDIPRHKITAVGDALITDIAGADTVGIDSVLIGTGIHADALKDLPSQPGKIQELCRLEQQIPTTIVGKFSW
jgi:ribonucleotide monophosphatase NagD (HAD superfamily)